MFANRLMIPVMVAVFALAPTSGARGAGRLSDKEALKLMDDIAGGVRDVSQALPKDMRTATVSTAEGEVNIEQFLNGLVKDAEEMRKNLRSGGSGSSEAKRLLMDGVVVQERMDSGNGLFGAEDAWKRLDGQLGQLAAAYGIDLSVDPSTWDVYRMNDKAVREAVNSLGQEARKFMNEFRREVKKMDMVTGPDQKQVIDHVKSLMTSSEELRDELIHSRDVTSELRAVVASSSSVGNFLAQHDFSIDTQKMWDELAANIKGIAGSLRED